jgi:hypothetical protein
MKTHEQENGRKVFTVMIYHVTDVCGRPRFLSVNSFLLEALGGTNVFEGLLARRYRTYELFGTVRMASCEDNPLRTEILDTEGVDQLAQRFRKAMASCPNSAGLERWVPEREEDIPPAPVNMSQEQWMSFLRERSARSIHGGSPWPSWLPSQSE